MTQVPHFAYPFRFAANGHARVLEQDFVDEIANCCQVILKTTIGSRPELPEFGVNELVFQARNRLSTDDLMAVLQRWEPRADAAIVDGQLLGSDATRVDLNVEVHGREGE